MYYLHVIPYIIILVKYNYYLIVSSIVRGFCNLSHLFPFIPLIIITVLLLYTSPPQFY